MLITVIITSYNQKQLLAPTIESVLNQTLRPHEIIVADDCSTDGSQEVILNFKKKYGNCIIPLLSERNRGIPGNRNFALRHVTGEYLSILDGDDLYLPDKISREHKILQADPSIDCIYSNFQRIALNGSVLSSRFDTIQPSGNIFPSVAKGTFGILRTMLARFEAIKKVGFLDINAPKYDGFLLSALLAKFCKFAYIDKSLVLKKEYPQSDSKQLTKIDHYNDLIYIWNILKSLIKSLPQQNRTEITNFWEKLISNFDPNSR